ncbi:uncharacterized protein FMAN_04950 [Fusarium mangiferae]|uniref:Uncharacterized protein n=1 Tax=Fusarium mangiferae TaxID=192010 RepID=A0A1L7SP76_FUSMA|nr:uncharacterized protein FMAN_04950 [Fusarium mangiferae]CVK88370.1 uncharacterized protein FMAN_04950 [Fusarium mangiferae]
MSPPTFDSDAKRCAKTMLSDEEEPAHIIMDGATSKTMDIFGELRSRMILSTSPPAGRAMQASAVRSINSK